MYPLTAVTDDEIVGHILLRFPSEDKSLIRFGFVITLGVFCDNHSAVECYKSVGFRITGTDAYSIDGEEWK
jgi:ribosomal protein S18 acetylase RimI-like enzyme